MSRPTKPRDPAFATTLANGLSVLDCFRSGEPVLSNRDLAERTGLSKATISRLTYTLALKGLLLYDTHLRRYRLGGGILSLNYPLLAGMRVRQLARPYMRELATQTGGTVSLGLYDRLHMVYVETIRGHDLASFRPDIGARLPVLASAMGRAWLAQASPATRQTVLLALDQAAPWQGKQHADTLAGALHDWQQYGYCVSEGAWQADVHAVGVPMASPIDGETLVFNCGVTVTRLEGTSIRHSVAPSLRAMVNTITLRLAQEPDHAQ